MRFRSSFSALFLAALFLSYVSPAKAATFIGKDNVSIDKPIKDDVYITAGDVEVAGDIAGDLIAAGGNIKVTGDVKGDLFATAGTIVVDGDVGNTARVAGGRIELNGRVERDLMVGAGMVLLGKGGAVGGDVLAGSGSINVLGPIKGDVIGGFGNADLNGPIGGDVKIEVDRLTVGDKARLAGDLHYRSLNKAEVASGAKIGGEVTRRPPLRRQISPGGRAARWLWSLSSMIIIGLIIAWLFPESLRLAKETLVTQPWAGLGVGFAALFLVPIAILMAMLTLVGMPLALIVLVLYIIAIYLSQIYAAAALGSLLLDRDGETWAGAGAALGIALMSIVRLIPLIDWLVSFALVLFGLGAMVIAVWRARYPTPAAG